jgi:hypothetical protein
MNGLRAYLLTAPQRQTLQAYPDGALAWNDQGTFCYARPWSKRPKNSAVVSEDLRHLIVTPGLSTSIPYGRDILRSEDPKLVLSRLIYRGAKARVERVLVNGCRVDGEKL